MPLSGGHKRTLLISSTLAAITLALFWPLTQHDFVSYDDTMYVTENPHLVEGFSWRTVDWAMRSGYAGNWHPVTWLSHALDVQLFGFKAGGHHLVSAVFHAINAVLVFLAFQSFTAAPWRSAMVAALFAWHPLHVESVSWASERKDVLSGFFFLLTLLAYANYVRRLGAPGETTAVKPQTSTMRRSGFWYALTLIFFALGLMSKPMLVTLPFLLLLLDYWPLGRFQPSTSIQTATEQPPRNFQIATLPGMLFEKVPFFLLTIVSALVTLVVQSKEGAVVSLHALPVSERVAGALVATTAYLVKALLPVHLAVFYPRPEHLAGYSIVLSVLVLAVTTIWVCRGWRTQKYLAVGWLWFLGMLVPVIGLMQVGLQFMADRYTYLPLIGVFVMLVWTAGDQLARLGSGSGSQRAGAAAAAAILLVCLALSRRQIGFWANTETLFAHSMAVTGPNYTALNNYGQALAKAGKWDLATEALDAAISLDPSLDAAYAGLGGAMMEQGKLDDALVQFNKALRLHPGLTGIQMKIGIIYGRQGKLAEAAAVFEAVLAQKPEEVAAHNNLGNVLTLQGKYEAANLHFAEAVRLVPQNPSAHNNLALNYRKLGRQAEALAEYREAVRLQPDFLEALNNLAWALAANPDPQYRDGTEALGLATRACELTRYEHPAPLATLAIAYAETGQFPEAISFAQRALEIAGPNGGLAPKLNTMIDAFKAGRTYRE